MKKIYTLLSAVLVSASLWAQAPQSFSYQAVVRGANNVLVIDKVVGMKVSILQGSENGTVVYSESHTSKSNSNGLVSVAIGNGNVLSGVFTKIDWSNGIYFIKTETDPLGGTAYALSSISQLLSVPYALVSNNGISRISEIGDSLVLTNGKSIIIPGLSVANHKSNPTSGYGPNITDVEGNSYKTVYIGKQQWMAENLKVSKYNDGAIIPNAVENSKWLKTNKSWSYYNNDTLNNVKYGKLYNKYAVSSTLNGNKNICPTGWHVPSDLEWTILTDYLGGELVAGGKMKESGNTIWNLPNTNATNSSLFNGTPGGKRDFEGNFLGIGFGGLWWSSTQDNSYPPGTWIRSLSSSNGSIGRSKELDNGLDGFSVRCLRD